MAKFKSLNNDRLIYLKPVHVFGRDPQTSDVVLECPMCSRLHAVVRWQAGSWLLTDESRNGCELNGKPMVTGRSVKLNVDDCISFPGEPKQSFVVVSDEAPQAVLLGKDSGDIHELQRINILPNEEQAECLICNQGDHWLVEQGEAVFPLYDGQTLVLAEREWVFHPNDLLQDTIPQLHHSKAEESLKMTFNISLDEENIGLVMDTDHAQYNLGEKAHHYPMLLLAKQRIVDKDKGIAEKEMGWLSTDVLMHELRTDASHLNILIYRARKAVSQIDPLLGRDMIQRRPGEIRIMHCDMTLNKGEDQLQYAV